MLSIHLSSTKDEEVLTLNKNTPAFERISKVLGFIHSNLSSPLSLEEIATQSCWSRWQLQRVFQSETGMTVANYVRELKLSRAAELLLDEDQRVIDIAIALGFNSEISFSRSFKQMFEISPSQYRKSGKRVGLKKPIEVSDFSAALEQESGARFVEVKIDERDAFLIKGMSTEISGLFSLTQDFAQKVPQLWAHLEQEVVLPKEQDLRFMGVVDITQANFDGTNLKYWAGVVLDEEVSMPTLPSVVSEKLEILTVPKQTYAVVKHKGPIQGLPKTLSWFVLNWLPSSGYRGIDGYELEVYPKDYQSQSQDAEMEYWIPIVRA